MSQDPHRSDAAAREEERRCPICDERIRPAARRCRHCGQSLTSRGPAKLAARAGSVVGVLTALLSLFYALREGFHFVSLQQQKRADVASYKEAAARLERVGNLVYAKAALDRALEVEPSDPELQLRAFLLEGEHTVVELEDWGGGGSEHEKVAGLIQDGFRLLARDYPRSDRAQLLLLLGRLLAYDSSWQKSLERAALWDEALSLAPEDPQVVFWRGHALLGEEGREQEVLEAFRRAAALDPENAFYWEEIGEHGADLGVTAESIRAYRRAIELHPVQSELQSIRASNEAHRQLATALERASEVQPIEGEEFYGIPMEEREDLVTLAYESSSSSYFPAFAGRFYYARGRDEEALAAMKEALGDYEDYLSDANVRNLELMVEILERTGLEPESLPRAREILDRRLERDLYDEVLETGVKGGRRYKLGLRTSREPSEESGLLVLRVFDGYPFAKAGVREGDRILRFAHRSTATLRDIFHPLIEFPAGSDVPVQVARDGQELDLTLIVE